MSAEELKEVSKKALQLMDLTSLNDNDTDEKIVALCQSAKTVHNLFPAAVCIYPRFIPVARNALAGLGLLGKVRIATVANFPHGSADVERAVSETKACVAYGADEVDVVFPYKALIQGDEKVGAELVRRCKEVCESYDKSHKALLKVIIESGELKEEKLIRRASEICIAAGADFIKTSTGKVPVNATPEAARFMIDSIAKSSRKASVGFKAAGGVRDAVQSKQFLEIAAELMGKDWATPATFRFGASSLLKSLLETIQTGAVPVAPAPVAAAPVAAATTAAAGEASKKKNKRKEAKKNKKAAAKKNQKGKKTSAPAPAAKQEY